MRMFNALSRLVSVMTLLATVWLSMPAAHAVTIDWVTVGNPGNANDTTGYGAVAEAFQIMKFEFTNSQYAAFLNAIDPAGTNPNAVYNNSMGSNARGGITNTGTTNGSRYVVKSNMGNKPVNYVSWWDAARVSNWLHNGAQTYVSTDSSATAPQNTGAYEVGTSTSGNAVAVNARALFYVPTENEWYKAAFYNPTLNSGAGGYHFYGNGFDTTPGIVSADTFGNGSAGSTGNFANYAFGADWNGLDGNVTTVGTNGGSSYYGTFDMSGNVLEWNDLTGVTGLSRGLRRGDWGSSAIDLLSVVRREDDPSGESVFIGFRLASPVAVPEPSTWVMGLAGIACAGWGAWRRRKRPGRTRIASTSIALVAMFVCTGYAHAVTIDWVTVGNPGNANDTATGNLYGAVAEAFQIMKFEFTNSQYAAFLNAIDPAGTNPNSVYNANMGSSVRGGITNTGQTNGSRYVVKSNMGDKPVNFVSWWDAARVSNWLHNGAQTYGSTDSSASAPQNTGAYTVGTATSGNAVAVNAGALFYVPTENEWYKAAFYSPTLNGGAGGYRVYGNGFDTTPGIALADTLGNGTAGGTGNFANYNLGADWNSLDGNVTTVGTNGGSSYYGAFDMSGNVWEWNDLTGAAGSSRGVRGGDWDTLAFHLSSSFRQGAGAPSFESSIGDLGFRLASPVAVPEPSTWVMGLAGVACAGWGAWRRRRAR